MYSGNGEVQRRVDSVPPEEVDYEARKVRVFQKLEGTCNAEMDDLERHVWRLCAIARAVACAAAGPAAQRTSNTWRRQGRTTTPGARDELICMAEKAQSRQRSKFMAQPVVRLSCGGDSGGSSLTNAR
jgi:hypothetical protein